MVSRSDAKIPWLPIAILLIGIIVFWVVPQFQTNQNFKAAPLESSK